MSIKKVKRKSKKDGWQAFVRDVQGQLRRKTFDRKIDAEQWEREQLELRRKPDDLELNPEMLFSELIDEWDSSHVVKLEPSTAYRYREVARIHFLPTFGDMKLTDIKVSDVDAWQRKLMEKTKPGPSTRNWLLGCLKGLFNWGLKCRYLLVNPASPVSPENEQANENKDFNIWSAEEIDLFLDATKDSTYYPLYLAALNTGMRLGELVALRWDKVDLKRRIIQVSRTWDNKAGALKNVTKGKRSRVVPINNTLRVVLTEQKLRGREWVFTDEEGNRIKSHAFTDHTFRPTCRRHDLKELRFHDLRHTYASHFMMNGGDVFQLQKVLGHKDITTTQRYMHFAQSYLQEAADVVEFGAKKLAEVIYIRKAANDMK